MDQASRKDPYLQQKVREAMELFNMLAAVSRDGFLKLLLKDIIDKSEKLGSPNIFPLWKCILTDQSSSIDLVANQATVTWGALLGCPSDPWEYSPEFRGAMHELEERGRGIGRVVSGKEATISWETRNQVVATVKDTKEHLKDGEIGLALDQFSRELGKMFQVVVAPVAHLAALRDKTILIDIWERHPLDGIDSGDVEVLDHAFSSQEMLAITSALALSKLTSLTLPVFESFVDALEDATGAGFLFGSMIDGNAMCNLVGCELDIPLLVPCGSIENFCMKYDGICGPMAPGICSALAGTSLVKKLAVQSDREYFHGTTHVLWGWIAYALLCPASSTSVRTLEMTCTCIRNDDMAVITSTLKNIFPSSSVEEQGASRSQYGFVDIQKGAQLRIDGVDNAVAVTATASRRCRARVNSDDASNQACVVVPGCGICSVQVDDGVNAFIPDSSLVPRRDNFDGIQSLILDFCEVENDVLVPDLITLVGKHLKQLTLSISDDVDLAPDINLGALAVACPELETLHLDGFDVMIPSSTVLRNWGLKELTIWYSGGSVGSLLDCFDDSTHRMANELVTLEIILTPMSWQIHKFEMVLDELQMHDGDYLPVTKEKLPLSAKLAMISAVISANHEKEYSRTIERLDANVLEIIFNFASEPQRRSVRVSLLT